MSILRSVPLCLALTFLLTLTACQADSAKSPAVKTEPPAKLTGAAVKEAELTSISLTEAAEKRLGIRIEEARAGRGSTRTSIRRRSDSAPGQHRSCLEPGCGNTSGTRPDSIGGIADQERPATVFARAVPASFHAI